MFKIIKYTRKRNKTTSETESEQSLNYIYVTTRSPDTDVKIDFLIYVLFCFSSVLVLSFLLSNCRLILMWSRTNSRTWRGRS